MPKNLKTQNVTGIASIVLILVPVALVLIAGVVLYTLGIIRLPGKQSSTSPKSSNDVQVELKKEYQNPFDKSTQYQNPFSENPFDQLK